MTTTSNDDLVERLRKRLEEDSSKEVDPELLQRLQARLEEGLSSSKPKDPFTSVKAGATVKPKKGLGERPSGPPPGRRSGKRVTLGDPEKMREEHEKVERYKAWEKWKLRQQGKEFTLENRRNLESPFPKKEERPGLAKRVGATLWNTLIEVGVPDLEDLSISNAFFGVPGSTVKQDEAAIKKRREEGGWGGPGAFLLEHVPGYKEKRKQFEKAHETLTRKVEDVVSGTQVDIPPPETTGEKVADAAGGLVAFLARLVILKKIMPGSIPVGLRDPVAFEIDNQLNKGEDGHGLAMGFFLKGVQALPISTASKIGAESVGFGGLAILGGGDDVDIMISMAIPPALRGMGKVREGFKKELRAARNTQEAADVITRAVAAGREAMKAQGVKEPTWDEIVQGVKKYEAELEKVGTRKSQILTPEVVERARAYKEKLEKTVEPSKVEPWQETREQFQTRRRAEDEEWQSQPGRANHVPPLMPSHKTEVKRALEDGKPVPPEVLAEYPELMKGTEPSKVETSRVRAEDIAIDNAGMTFTPHPIARKLPPLVRRIMERFGIGVRLVPDKRWDELEKHKPLPADGVAVVNRGRVDVRENLRFGGEDLIVAHELGHIVDARLKLAQRFGKADDATIIELGEAGFGGVFGKGKKANVDPVAWREGLIEAKDQHGMGAEAVAQALGKWMVDPTGFAKKYPRLAKMFEGEVGSLMGESTEPSKVETSKGKGEAKDVPIGELIDEPTLRKIMESETVFGEVEPGRLKDLQNRSLKELDKGVANTTMSDASVEVGHRVAKKIREAAQSLKVVDISELKPSEIAGQTIRVHRAGEPRGPLIHAGTREAAEAAATGREVSSFEVTLKNPAKIIDSARSHDVRPAALAEDLVKGGNKGIPEYFPAIIKKIQTTKGDKAAFEAIAQTLRTQGYDGIVYKNANEAKGSTSVVLLSEPEAPAVVGKIGKRPGQKFAPGEAVKLKPFKPAPEGSPINNLKPTDRVTFDEKPAQILRTDRDNQGRVVEIQLMQEGESFLFSGEWADNYLRQHGELKPPGTEEPPAVAGKVGPEKVKPVGEYAEEIHILKTTSPLSKEFNEALSRIPPGVKISLDPEGVITKIAKGKDVRLTELEEAQQIKRFKEALDKFITEPLKEEPPAVAGKIGPEAEPVKKAEKATQKPTPLVFNKTRPRRMTLEDFTTAWNEGKVRPVKGLESQEIKDQYDARVKSGQIVQPAEKRGRPKSSLRELLISPEAAEARGDRPIKQIEQKPPELTAELAEQAQLLGEGLRKLTNEERAVVENLFGMRGERPFSYTELAEKFGVSESEIKAVEDSAMAKLRTTLGAEELKPPSTSLPRPPTNAPGARPGSVSSYPISTLMSILRGPIAIGDRILQWEARDMIQNVARGGGAIGKMIADVLRKGVDVQRKLIRGFQERQLVQQRTINHHPLASWRLQSQTRQKGQIWTISDMEKKLQGVKPPANKGEAEIIRVLREGNLATGELAEQVGLEITLSDGSKAKFKKAPDGKVMLMFPTPQAHDIILYGAGMKNKLYEAYVESYYQANKHLFPDKVDPKTGKIVLGRTTVRTIIDKVRESIAANDPRAGFRQIGPELERSFDVHPEGMYSPNNGKYIPLRVTHPRQYLDTLYNSTGLRLGFIQVFGQDGTAIRRLRWAYHKAQGNLGAFDVAVRTMSDIPPFLVKEMPLMSKMPSPDSVYYNVKTIAEGSLSVLKQVMLSSTAPLQLTEPVGSGAMYRYRNLVKAIWELRPFSRSRKAALAEMVRMGTITKDQIDWTLDRQNKAKSMFRLASAVMSRAHANKFANEGANEQLLARQAHFRILDAIRNGQEGKGPKIDDVRFFQTLDFSRADAIMLATGKPRKGMTKEQLSDMYDAARQRASRQATGSTALMSETSPLRNTRFYNFMVPFTMYFSNRWRNFDIHARLIGEAVKAKDPKRIANSTYAMGKFLGGVEAAGIIAVYLWAYLRDGPLGVKQKFHDMMDDPVDFLWESLVYGSFGPVYGALTQFGGQVLTGESSENIARSVARLAFPIGVSMDIWDAWQGTGKFKDREPGERFWELMKTWTPLSRTYMPAGVAMSLAGIQVDDPEMSAAVKAYWRWRFEPENECRPSSGGSLGDMTEEHKRYRILLRRAVEDQLNGRNPYPNLIEAFLADPGDIAAAIRGKKLLESGVMDDDKRRRIKESIGEESYKILEQHDLLLEIMAMRVKEISQLGRRAKEQDKLIRNLEKRLKEGVG